MSKQDDGINDEESKFYHDERRTRLAQKSNIEPKCIYPECGPTCRKDCPPLPAKPIEPTEEQLLAADEFLRRAGPLSPSSYGDVRDVARLLAKREAKLREEVATLNANNDQLVRALDEGGFCYPASNVPRFIVHDRLESAGDWYDPATRRILHMDPAKAFALQDERDTLRARVAELEAGRDEWRDNAGVALEAWERASVREAQHLADIKALMVKVQDAYDRGVEDAHNRGPDIGVTDLLAPFAHYDDAKADAPASTEGGEG